MSSSVPTSPPEPHLPTLGGRAFRCQCGCPVFFRNSECLACGTPLGYDPEQARLLPLMPGLVEDTWVVWHSSAPGPAQQDLATSPEGSVNIVDQQGQGPTGSHAPPALMQSQSQSPSQSQSMEAPPPEGSVLPPPAPAYMRCGNLQTPAACNWLVPYDEANPAPLLCRACRLNRMIPDLNDPVHPDNGVLWGKVELAKRRLVSALLSMGLPVASRITEDTERGMMFDILRSPDNGPHVMTGHNTGLITLNLQEADDAVREAVRTAMREPYRTLLGHFRHEVGHYYWDRLVWGTEWMEGFHRLFGDEQQDYSESLKRNYEQGPPPQWWLHYVSAYASMHPWEDWAECWAHYLHMRDTIDTALSFGLAADSSQLEFTPFTLDALYQPDHPDAQRFLDFLNDWTQLTTMLNEMSRSMGQPDFYPFVMPHEVVAKLHFIHLLVTSASWLPADPAVIKHAQEEIDHQLQMPTQSQSQGYSQPLGEAQPEAPLQDNGNAPMNGVEAPPDSGQPQPEDTAEPVATS
ncbi:MAG: putative zinc-binding metallopeptidase [Polaromonas sp.]|nr:putative zinc-binding metallopeptidase [Polaromonas sp.]